MKDIKNITVNYDNNESKTITKGLVIDFGKLDNDEGDVCFNMCNNQRQGFAFDCNRCCCVGTGTWYA